MNFLNIIIVKKFTKLVALVSLMVGFTNSPVDANTVINTPEAPFPLSVNTELQAQLEQRIEQRGLQGEVANQRLSVTLVDITDIEKPRLAHVNGDNTFYAASLPKLAIMLAVFEEVHLGKLERTEELEKSLKAMMQVSSNVEATRLYELVGPERIAEILQSERYQLYDIETGGGLWVGKPYGKQPAWKRDPLKNASHAASGVQVARFYFMMERNELTSPDYCIAMKDILADSLINHKFVKGLQSKNPDAEVYRKSGTWRNYHSDSALVERPDGRKYIAVGLTQNVNGGSLLENIIVDLDTLMDDSPLPVKQ